MIEAGLSIIAACLPTLRYLFGSVALEQIVRSVRSTFSLSSLSSRHSRDRTEATAAGDKNADTTSQGSSSRIHTEIEAQPASEDKQHDTLDGEEELI